MEEGLHLLRTLHTQWETEQTSLVSRNSPSPSKCTKPGDGRHSPVLVQSPHIAEMMDQTHLSQYHPSLAEIQSHQHTTGSRRAQDRVTERIVQKRRTDALEADYLDGILLAKKEKQLSIQREILKQRNEERREERRRTIAEQQREQETYKDVSWALSDLPILKLNKVAKAESSNL